MAAKKKNENTEPKKEEVKQDTVSETETPQEAPAEVPAEKQTDSDKYLRLMAEFDNYKKRSAKERENIYTDVRVDTVSKFLPVYDNLERALKAETADEAYKKGVELTFNQLRDVFKKLGVEEIESIGKAFDPNLHNAVMHVEDEELEQNVVAETFQKGYKMGEKVLRYAMVKVAN